MRLLVLGGTAFLGRHTVEAALGRGDEVTIFTRGRTNPELFPEAEHLVGDRDGDLGALAGRTWDGVVDTSGYVPRVLRLSAELLRGAVGRYVFVSSISVYGDFSRPVDEESDVAYLEDPFSENVEADYGALKAACEHVVDEVYGERGASVRAGLLVGPHDPTDRFTYWPRRLAEGGDVLAPGTPDAPVQLVDARDLGAWLVELGGARPRRRLQRDRAGGAADARRAARAGDRRGRLGRTARLDRRAADPRRGRRSRGWSCRSGCPATTTPASSAPPSDARSPPACASGRSRRPCATRSRGAAKRESSGRR